MAVDDDIRALLVELCAKNDADFAVAYRITEMPDGHIRCVGIVSHGSDGVAALAPRLEGTPYARLDVTVGNVPPTNRWNVRTRTTLASGWIGANVWDVLGIGSQMGIVPVDNGTVWGWIGVLRWKTRVPFEPRDELTALPGGREVARRVTTLDRIATDLPASPGAIVVADGRPIYHDPGWRPDEPRVARFLARLDAPRDGQERFGYVDGAAFAASVLVGPQGPAWLVRGQRAVRLPATPLLELPPRQRQVAELAARGATVAEIAQAIEATENTVKTHLRRAYEACGVATRSELLELLNATIPLDDIDDDA